MRSLLVSMFFVCCGAQIISTGKTVGSSSRGLGLVNDDSKRASLSSGKAGQKKPTILTHLGNSSSLVGSEPQAPFPPRTRGVGSTHKTLGTGTGSHTLVSRAACSPKRYVVTLRHRHCTRRVETKVQYDTVAWG